jgi:hypothetical protein
LLAVVAVLLCLAATLLVVAVVLGCHIAAVLLAVAAVLGCHIDVVLGCYITCIALEIAAAAGLSLQSKLLFVCCINCLLIAAHSLLTTDIAIH